MAPKVKKKHTTPNLKVLEIVIMPSLISQYPLKCPLFQETCNEHVARQLVLQIKFPGNPSIIAKLINLMVVDWLIVERESISLIRGFLFFVWACINSSWFNLEMLN